MKSQSCINKLRRLGVLEQFKANYKSSTGNKSLNPLCGCADKWAFKVFVMRAFIWDRTPEGFDFWNNISLK